MSFYGNKAEIIKPLDLFSSVETVSRDTLVELKPTYGVSAFRDIATTTGSGTVSDAVGQSEFTLGTGTTTGSTSRLTNTERGRYVPGSQGQIGMGIRANIATYSGTAQATWGYYTDNDGFGFGVDSSGVYVFIRNGADNKIYQEDWNIDKFDGQGPSAITLDLTEGYIFQIDYSWYGYGDIVFRIVGKKPGEIQKVYPIHVFSPSGETSVDIPNLPLRVDVDNGDQATDYKIFIGGRQYSILTASELNSRVNSDIRVNQGSINTTFVPTVSFREKNAYISVSIKLASIALISDASLEWQIRLGGTLTGASFGTPSNTTAKETACDSDVSATAITGGELLDRGILNTSGGGALTSGTLSSLVTELDIPEESIVTLCVRRLSGTGATVTSVLKWQEQW